MFSCFILNTYVVNTGLFINNEFVAGDNTIETINPATGKVITSVQAGNDEYSSSNHFIVVIIILWYDIYLSDHLLVIIIAESRQVNTAVEAAHKAFHGGWKTSIPRNRARLMHKLADLVERDANDLAHLETLDNGKPLKNAQRDIIDVSNYM